MAEIESKLHNDVDLIGSTTGSKEDARMRSCAHRCSDAKISGKRLTAAIGDVDTIHPCGLAPKG
jgi:hypothetical protein